MCYICVYQASIIGFNFGKVRWPGTSKTVEGTLAGCLSVLLVAFLISLGIGSMRGVGIAVLGVGCAWNDVVMLVVLVVMAVVER